jgi:hypothetical protein
MEELKETVARLPPHTVILFLHIFRDGAGHTFTPLESLALVAERANAPIFVFLDQFLMKGVIGGNVFSLNRHGEKAAQLALRVLNGEKPADIAVSAEGPNVTVLNSLELQRWGIDEQRVPPGAIMQDQAPSPWDAYRWHILSAVTLFVAQGTLILALLVQRSKRGAWKRRSGKVAIASKTWLAACWSPRRRNATTSRGSCTTI